MLQVNKKLENELYPEILADYLSTFALNYIFIYLEFLYIIYQQNLWIKWKFDVFISDMIIAPLLIY